MEKIAERYLDAGTALISRYGLTPDRALRLYRSMLTVSPEADDRAAVEWYDRQAPEDLEMLAEDLRNRAS